MSEPATQQSHNDFSELPVGEILRRTRLHYDRSVEEVEAALRIQAKQIHAIEIGNMAALPARVYAIGFVRSYAEYLGLDGDKIVDLFKSQTNDTPAQSQTKAKLASVKQTPQSPPVGIAVALFALLCFALVMIFGLGNGKQKSEKPPKVQEEIIPEVPKELTVKALEEKQATTPKIEPPPKPVEQKQEGIVLKMVQNSWVEIRDANGRKLISRVLNKGDKYFVPERLDLSISIGNAGGVEILVDGDPLDGLGKQGQVLRNIPLNANALLKRFPKAETSLETAGETE